jgi:glycine dehydrogenase
MLPPNVTISWPEFGAIHPFVPSISRRLSRNESLTSKKIGQHHRLCRHFTPTTFRRIGRTNRTHRDSQLFHDKGEGHRNVCLIPSSPSAPIPHQQPWQHEIIVIKATEAAKIDIDDLKAKAEETKTIWLA